MDIGLQEYHYIAFTIQLGLMAKLKKGRDIIMNDDYINWVGNKVVDNTSKNKNSKSTTRDWYSKEAIPTMNPVQIPDPVQTPDPVYTPDSVHIPDNNLDQDQNGPPLITDKSYIPGYLMSIIGKRIRAEFIIGTNQFTDRTGILKEVGVNYFVIQDFLTNALVMCDLYSVKFVTTF